MSFNAKLTIELDSKKYEGSIPEKETKEFLLLAENEFDNNIGMAFKELLQALILRPEEFFNIYSILKEHEGRLGILEKNPEEEKDMQYTEKKTISGRVIRYKQKNRGGE